MNEPTLVTQTFNWLLIGLLIVLWVRDYRSFPSLARKFLYLGPFLPLVSLLNHNVDNDRWGDATRVTTIYVTLGLLLLSLLVWRARGARLRLGAAEVFLLLYAGLCLLQIPGSKASSWALWSWSWSVPGYLLFLMAGRASSREEFYRDKLPAWAFFCFAGISLGLVAFGLLTGRADQLFHTRNFGSIYASTAMLMYVTLIAGVCWRLVRESASWTLVFLLVTCVCLVLSLSRTASGVLGVYLAMMFTSGWIYFRRALTAMLLISAILLGAFLMVRDRYNLDYQLLAAWSERFRAGDYGQAYGEARTLRENKFAGFRQELWRVEPWHGAGFGTFRLFSDYTDAHDLLVTEAFENSLLAAGFLALAFSIPSVVRALLNPDLRGIAISMLGFIALGQLTGAMLSYRAAGAYYSPYLGWMLFYLVGFVNGQLAFRKRDHVDQSPA